MNFNFARIFFHHSATLTRNSKPHPFPERRRGVECTRQLHSKITFYASLWQLTTRNRRFAIKLKAQLCTNPVGILRLLTKALKLFPKALN